MKRIFSESLLRHMLLLAAGTKFFAYLSLKGIYPLAAFLEVDWQIERDDFNLILAVSELSSIPSLFLGPVVDKYHLQLFCVLSWFLVCLSTLLLSVDFTDESFVQDVNGTIILLRTNPTSFYYVLFCRVLFGLSVQVFVTTNLTILLAVMPANIKEAAAGIVEYVWALSALIGIPLIALIYDNFGVTYAFLIPGIIMTLIGFDFAHFLLCSNLTVKKVPSREVSLSSLYQDLKHISFILICIKGILLNISYNSLYTVLSLWLTDEFDQSVSETGISFFVIGIAELTGSTFYSFVAAHKPEKIYHVAYVTTTLFSISLALLAFTETLSSALTLVYFNFTFFEYTAVTIIIGAADYIEIKHRVTALSVFSGCVFLGRSIGAILGGRFYSSLGFRQTLLVISIITFISLFFLVGAKVTIRDFTEFDEEESIVEENTQKRIGKEEEEQSLQRT